MTPLHTPSNPAIRFPTAEELDTEAYSQTGGWKIELYLVPSKETDDGAPKVVEFQRNGPGTPAPAYHRRWRHITTVPAKTVGESVLRWLQSVEDVLLALDEHYLGSEWDGHNHIGKWNWGPDDDEDLAFESALDPRDAFEHYWEAGDWFVDRNSWEDFCREFKMDPESALSEAWREVVAELAKKIEDATDEHVSGIEEYVENTAQEYREEQKNDEDRE